MRILVFSWRDPKHPTAGGAEQVMHEHMKGWVKAGNTVTLFSSMAKGLSNSENLDGIKIVRQGIQYFGVQLLGFLYYIKNSKKFDLVVDQFHGIPFFTPLYVKKPKLAVIQEVAGKVWLKNDLPFPLNWIFGVIGYLGEPIIFLFYKKVPFMTGSNSAREDLIKMNIPVGNIKIVPHGVLINKPKPMPEKEKVKTVMYLGSITQDKGISDVIKTFSLLNKKGAYNFWIVGKASERYKQLMKDMLKKYNISKNTKYFGFVDEKTKFDLLSRAHVLINPSVLEGWGLVNIEANAMGTPVVAYNSPGLVDSVKDGVSGIICKLNTPESMADEVSKLLENSNMYALLQKSAIKWSNNFSWERSTKESLTLINKFV